MHGRLRVGVPTSGQFSFVNFTLVGSVIPNRPCGWLSVESCAWTPKGRRPYQWSVFGRKFHIGRVGYP